MMFLRYSLLSTALVLGLFVAAPALASAATLYVDVDVQNSYNYNNLNPNDLTIEVWGNNVSPRSFRGSSSRNRERVTLDEGYYSVSVKNTYGYTLSLSSGCSGFIKDNVPENCTVTLWGSNYNYPPNYNQGSCQGSCAPQTYYAQPVITKGYVPYMPNTGFEPQNGAALAFAGVVLMALGLFLYPYVRKVFTIVLR